MLTYRVLQPEGPFTPTEAVLPEPLAGQVRVRIHASGVNPLDVKIRSGTAPHAKQPLPPIDYRTASVEQYVSQHSIGP